MLRTMLELDGFEVVGDAASGPEGIELASAIRPDVVVIDYRMPRMDGISAARAIRAGDPAVPMILYTAYLDGEIERDARDAGVTACIGKVQGIERLEREISALCLELTER